MRFALETYLRENEGKKVENLDDPELQDYMDKFHPRFFQLV